MIFSGNFELLINVSSITQNLAVFSGDPTTGEVTLTTVAFAPGVEIDLSGDMYVFGILDFKGAVRLPDHVLAAGLDDHRQRQPEPESDRQLRLHRLSVAEFVGLVAQLSSTLSAGFGSGVGINLTGSFLLDINTTGATATYIDNFGVSHSVAPGFLMTINGGVNFLGFASATGTITISISNSASRCTSTSSSRWLALKLQRERLRGHLQRRQPRPRAGPQRLVQRERH